MSKAKDSNLALRIVSSSAGTTPDFCIAEHSKKVTLSKSYYDKRKMVVVSLLHLKRHINCVHLSYQEATEFTLPFVICCGLRADIYTIRLVSEDWCAVEKCKDLDIPCCVAEVKEGKIVSYIHHLKSLKVCGKITILH
ncbi:uncharacterized protein BYT42DRAFT_80842 [Radiomyces spectabilis]|uniref:uncharacterized protein n=1 Tax=Radiomyces spectabilis TaxID=64574 RepID=UPI00222068FC|nr:uncharacterized protein BYT42DRAFT_80842 [Radiomyces spectabilis]KAI8371761.1 hypothetical protein BYT42DRAFT_80842 [Radiomyces spectabilis]